MLTRDKDLKSFFINQLHTKQFSSRKMIPPFTTTDCFRKKVTSDTNNNKKKATIQQNITLTLPIIIKSSCVSVCVWQGRWSSLQKRGGTATKVYTVSHQASIDSIFNDTHLGIGSGDI